MSFPARTSLQPLRGACSLLRSRRAILCRRYTTDNPVTINEPQSKAPAPNVSATNASPTSSTGAFDRALQEAPEEGEEKRVMQAPNRKRVWSRNQRPREEAMVGPRFEQATIADQ
ncbi:MAG: hypothetical protein M1831_001364, partial [Alyxoria varia]